MIKMSLRNGFLFLLVTTLFNLVASQDGTEITWDDIWNAQQTVWIGIIAGFVSLQVLTLLCCCGCIFFCRRMAVNEYQAQDAAAQPIYQDAAPPPQQIPYQPPQPVPAPQQPAYAPPQPPPTYRQDPYSRPTSVYYKNDSYRPVVRTYSTRPMDAPPTVAYR